MLYCFLLILRGRRGRMVVGLLRPPCRYHLTDLGVETWGRGGGGVVTPRLRISPFVNSWISDSQLGPELSGIAIPILRFSSNNFIDTVNSSVQ